MVEGLDMVEVLGMVGGLGLDRVVEPLLEQARDEELQLDMAVELVFKLLLP